MNKIIFLVGSCVFFTGCTVHAPVVDIPVISVEQPVKVKYQDNCGHKKCKHKHEHD